MANDSIRKRHLRNLHDYLFRNDSSHGMAHQMTHFTILQHTKSSRYEITPTHFVKDYSLDFWNIVWEGEATDRHHAMQMFNTK